MKMKWNEMKLHISFSDDHSWNKMKWNENENKNKNENKWIYRNKINEKMILSRYFSISS